MTAVWCSTCDVGSGREYPMLSAFRARAAPAPWVTFFDTCGDILSPARVSRSSIPRVLCAVVLGCSIV
jgi:hypothetical protein